MYKSNFTKMWVFLITTELIFYALFHLYLKPRADDLSKRSIKRFRDYDQSSIPNRRRHLLFQRILDRIEKRSKYDNKDFRAEFDSFLKRWFCFQKPHCSIRYANGASLMERHEEGCDSTCVIVNNATEESVRERGIMKNEMNSSFASSNNVGPSQNRLGPHPCPLRPSQAIDSTTISRLDQVIDRESLVKFFSWAFFDKFETDLLGWELDEINIMLEILKEKHNIVCRTRSTEDETTADYAIPRCMTLEKTNPIHRPLLFYTVSWGFRHLSYIILIFFGYRRFLVNCGERRRKHLTYWFKSSQDCCQMRPSKLGTNAFLFFHGIAPGGLAGYLPMLRYCLQGWSSRHPQHVFLFENLPITYNMSFDALSEDETVHGVEEALKKHSCYGKGHNLTLCGHSFGSFQLTWLLKAKQLSPLIQKIVVLDPVSILLSYPDVLINFLYNGGEDGGSDVDWKTKRTIRLAASSELFIEHYLRRHFAWYNSELWIEDIPDNIDVHMFISENDAIIDAKEVKKEIDRHYRKTIKCTFWEGHGHGDCIILPTLWADVSKSFEIHEKSL